MNYRTHEDASLRLKDITALHQTYFVGQSLAADIALHRLEQSCAWQQETRVDERLAYLEYCSAVAPLAERHFGFIH